MLNKAALKVLVTSALPNCQYRHMRTPSEDVAISKCFQPSGIFPFYTIDEEGGQRFNHFSVRLFFRILLLLFVTLIIPFVLTYHLRLILYQPHFYLTEALEVEDDHWINRWTTKDSKDNIDHFSNHSVSFHYIDSTVMRQMHAILYGYCDSLKPTQ